MIDPLDRGTGIQRLVANPVAETICTAWRGATHKTIELLFASSRVVATHSQ